MSAAHSGSKRFLFVTWDGGGNFVPALGIADALGARGHEVTFIAQRSLAPPVERRGFGFHAFERTPEWTAGVSIEEQLPTFAGLLYGSDIAEEVTAEIDLVQPDAVVVDCMLAGGLAAAERSAVPSAALVHMLDHASPDGILARSFSRMMQVVNDTRSGLGLAPAGAYSDLLEPMDLVLVTTLEAFDLAPSGLHRSTRYVGPVLVEGQQTPAADTPAGDEPLVLVSFSTTYQRQEEPLQRIADALAGLPVHGLMTLGEMLPANALRLPANVEVRAFVPHATLLPRASLIVTHAGLGTVMAALAHGIPLVCMPMGRDQDTNAQRVQALGAGLTLSVDAGVEELRRAVAEVLETPSYREAARALQAGLASAPGAGGAAEELVRLCT